MNILRRKQVEQKTGLKRATLYLYMRDKGFPKPVKLTDRAVGWLESEVEQWIKERAEARK